VTSDRLTTAPSTALEELLSDRLVAYNQACSAAVRERFLPGNLASEPVQAYLVGADGHLVGGCTGRVERVWGWLNVDTMWVEEGHRGTGVGSDLLASVENQARALGCRWSDVSTFDFQAPDFYVSRGYVRYAVKHDYPPGHSNHLLRKELE
jgi:GNAT superfamily N-acetyltransferase